MKVIEKADIAPIQPLLCSIEAGTVIVSRSKRFLIDAIARGLVRAVKSDRRTLLVVASLHEYVASLPPAKGTRDLRSARSSDAAKPSHHVTRNAHREPKRRTPISMGPDREQSRATRPAHSP